MYSMNTIQSLYPTEWLDYELIDSGVGLKLEKIGGYTIVRPDPRILWQKMAPDLWLTADAIFERTSSTEGHWLIKQKPPDSWQIRYNNLVFTLRPTEFKHIGVFPEQAVNWDWLQKIISKGQMGNGKKLKILNLFAYTGGATLAALSANAEVTHLDSVKSAIDWAGNNLKTSNLIDKPVRWIIEDAYKFVIKEIKRGNTYDGIIMDPPRFGRGSKGEVWKLEKDLPKLLAAIGPLMSPNFKLLLVNAYTADISSIALTNAVNDIVKDKNGIMESGELSLRESFGKRLVPNGIFARWNI
jgi:23S rRNA (cytosine1962-C5)-methyltransferase